VRVWLLALAALLLYGLIRFAVSRLIYRPTRYPRGWWHTQAESGAQDVWLRSSDGVRLHAWWVAVPGSRLATLYLHGNGANLSHRPGHLREMTAAGSSVLLIDYRGYGKSSGRPTERGLYRDADAGYDHLIAMGYRPEQIVVHGESLGSAVAADLAARRPCAGLVLECPLSSLSEMAGRIMPYVGRFFAGGFHTRRNVARVHVPLLVIHGDRDRVVPHAMGRAVFAAGHQPKTFCTVKGATHRTIVDSAGPRYRAELRAFYAGVPASR
jgi:pimeloyl-ACP methyl ester carboxylesterase